MRGTHDWHIDVCSRKVNRFTWTVLFTFYPVVALFAASIAYFTLVLATWITEIFFGIWSAKPVGGQSCSIIIHMR